MKRPLSLFVLISAVLIFLSVTFGKTFSLYLVLSIALSAIVGFIFYIKTKNIKSLLFTTCLVISLFSILLTTFYHLPKLETAKSLDGKHLEIEGKVTSLYKGERYSSFIVDGEIKKQNLPNCNVTLIVPTTDAENIDIGKYVSFSGTLEFSDDTINKGRESFLTVFTNDYEIIEKKSDVLGKIIYSLRDGISTIAEKFDTGAIIKALIIGDKSELDRETLNDFSTLGISHVLAISGLHLSVIAMSVYLFLNRLGLGLRLSSFVSTLLAILYMLVTGFTLSVVRAGQMLILFFLARNIRRKSDSITSLFLSGFLIILNSPWSLFNLGFQLSFLSTFGILVFLPPAVKRLESFTKRVKKWGNENHPFLFKVFQKVSVFFVVSVYSTLSATILTLPVILMTFNEFSLFSVLSNLIVVFLVKYLLFISVLVVGLASVKLTFLSEFFALINSLLYSGILILTEFLVSVSPKPISLNTTFIMLGTILVIVIVLISLFFSKRIFTIPLTALVITLFILVFNSFSSRILYSSFVIDGVMKRGCSATFVEHCGKTYLLELTDTNSKSVSDIISISEKRKYDKLENLVFVTTNNIPLERLEVLSNIFEIENVTLHIQDFDPEEFTHFYDYCAQENISLFLAPTETFNVTDGISTVNFDALCFAAIISNGKDGVTIYKELENGYRAPEFLNYGKVIYAKNEIGKYNNIRFSHVIK